MNQALYAHMNNKRKKIRQLVTFHKVSYCVPSTIYTLARLILL
jgi:hypothetical protein